MKVLIVAPYFPPYKSVGALRMASLVRYLKQKGVETIILTNSVEGTPEIESIYCYVDIRNNGEKYYTRFKRNRNIYCEEFQKIYSQYLPDIVVVSGGPFYTFDIACCAKKIGIPCILDFRDPWIFEYRGAKSFFTVKNIASKLIELPWERRAVHAASYVVTVTAGWKNNFKRFYPGINKFYKIENGYDDELLRGIDFTNLNTKKNKLLTLGVFGKLFYYTEEYSKIFLSAYRNFQNTIMIKQIGPVENNCQSLLKEFGIEQEKFASTGFLDYSEGMRQLSCVDAFIIIDVRKNAIGTKIYDYVFLNKPIIYVGPTNTVLAQMITNYKNGFVCSNKKDVERALASIKFGEQLDETDIARTMSRSYQNTKWLELIENCLNRNIDRKKL